MKKTVLYITGILLCLIIAGYLSISNKGAVARNRPPYPLSEEQIQEVKLETEGMDERQIIRYAVKYTSGHLSFSRDTNCYAYSDMTSTICNVAFSSNDYKESHAQSVVGHTFLFCIDVCNVAYKLTGDTFCMNHDYTMVKCSDGRTVFVDSTLYDLIGRMCWKEE